MQATQLSPPLPQSSPSPAHNLQNPPAPPATFESKHTNTLVLRHRSGLFQTQQGPKHQHKISSDLPSSPPSTSSFSFAKGCVSHYSRLSDRLLSWTHGMFCPLGEEKKKNFLRLAAKCPWSLMSQSRKGVHRQPVVSCSEEPLPWAVLVYSYP